MTGPKISRRGGTKPSPSRRVHSVELGFAEVLLGRCRADRSLGTRGHGNYAVFVLLGIAIFDLKQHLVLLDAELGFLAYRQQHRMLFVARSNAVDNAVALQQVFLT